MNPKDFETFYQKNRGKIDALAKANTKRNANGDTVISRDDPWFYEDEWDEDYTAFNALSKAIKEAIADVDNPHLPRRTVSLKVQSSGKKPRQSDSTVD